MAEFTSYEPGTPSWIDLATTDLEGAKVFYAGLFGWDAADSPSPAHGGRVEVSPMAIPDVGTFALLQDPQGAYFYALQGV